MGAAAKEAVGLYSNPRGKRRATVCLPEPARFCYARLGPRADTSEARRDNLTKAVTIPALERKPLLPWTSPHSLRRIAQRVNRVAMPRLIVNGSRNRRTDRPMPTRNETQFQMMRIQPRMQIET